MLLEEAVLRLLQSGGYTTVTQLGTDPTLEDGPAGLRVKGRGTSHQIDAIADSRIHHPFSHPQRLLVEAKCFAPSKKIDLEIVRGVVGVLKDVGEYWNPAGGMIQKTTISLPIRTFLSNWIHRRSPKVCLRA